MDRTTGIAIVVGVVVVAAVSAWTVHIVRQEQSAAIEQFSADRLRALQAVAHEMDKDFENIGEVLRFAGQLFASAGTTSTDRERELGALVTVGGAYLLALVYDADARRMFEVVSPTRQARPETLYPEIDAVARRALTLAPGQIDASPPFTADGAAWYRAFATSFRVPSGARWAVALLVDTEPLFAKVRLIVSDADTRLLVLGAHGLPAPASAPELTRATYDKRRDLPGFQRVVAAMREARSGTTRLDEHEARILGLQGATVVAAYAPIPFRGGYWSMATFSSTLPLRSRERAIVLRLGVGGAVIALCLVVFATFAVFATRRSSAMRERLKHATRLAHMHELTQKILDNVPSGILALSDDKRIRTINRALRARLANDAVGSELAQAFPAAPSAVTGKLLALVDAALQTGRVHSRHGEHIALFGKEGQYSLHAVPLEPRFPEARVLLVVEDLSEVRSLESRLLRAEKLATVGVLAAGIAHEIGTPLGVVRGRAEYMLGKLPSDSAHSAGMRVIIDQIDRVARTIRQLLDFARVKPAVVRAAAFAPVAQGVAELLRFELERRGVAIDVSVPDDLPLVSADPDQLQQVLVNLVMNACDACSPGGHVSIRASAKAGNAVRIEVSDDGCGIPEEHRHQVFDPFFTTKKRGQGTGLGLSIAAQIVSNHGGEIEIESGVREGTCVTVSWPLVAADEKKDMRRDVAI